LISISGLLLLRLVVGSISISESDGNQQSQRDLVFSGDGLAMAAELIAGPSWLRLISLYAQRWESFRTGIAESPSLFPRRSEPWV